MTDDMLRMQREAEQRVRDMQARSRQYFTSEGGSVSMPTPPMTIHHRPECPPPDPPKPSKPPKPCTDLVPAADNVLSSLLKDNDRLLLLMLAVLLVKSGAQIELIIALLYLAM